MKCVYTRLLSDDELRPHLERGETIAFKGLSSAWLQIERQVESLGFGDAYAVSRTSKAGVSGESNLTKVSPIRTQPEG